ncbi:sulfite exporter TauE/SafE family protein [Sulfuritalea sp.]|uniref:sulfite exporter TauE/SafE family protein n=1 Tax=Sulfuritalea sp. TaxID=2480090 RepID=UPI0025E177EE|nr:sulfite exporter TauE/SafE family protein [Sulfuritalea sp.]
MSLWWLGYPLLGVFAGFVAGLFGVGGGLTIVPLLFMLFTAQQFPVEHSMHLALGTSMATIVFTSVSSMRAHHGHGAVRWDIVKSFAPGLVAGTLAGSFLVAWVPTRPLAIMFTAIVYYASLQIMLDFKPKAHRQLPGTAGMVATGTLIGIFSSLVAAGGGFLSIPFMLFCNVGIRHAVGTSAALGFPIAVAGTIGFIGSGLKASGLPEFSLGYVYLPALVGVVAISFLMAPVGAGLAHRLPVRQLKRAFGGFLALLATKMLHGLLTG